MPTHDAFVVVVASVSVRGVSHFLTRMKHETAIHSSSIKSLIHVELTNMTNFIYRSLFKLSGPVRFLSKGPTFTSGPGRYPSSLSNSHNNRK
jgi:hypothetical protein